MSQQDQRDYDRIQQLRLRPGRLREVKMAAVRAVVRAAAQRAADREAQNRTKPEADRTSTSLLPISESPTEP